MPDTVDGKTYYSVDELVNAKVYKNHNSANVSVYNYRNQGRLEVVETEEGDAYCLLPKDVKLAKHWATAFASAAASKVQIPYLKIVPDYTIDKLAEAAKGRSAAEVISAAILINREQIDNLIASIAAKEVKIQEESAKLKSLKKDLALAQQEISILEKANTNRPTAKSTKVTSKAKAKKQAI